MHATTRFPLRQVQDVTIVTCIEPALIDTMVIEQMRHLLNNLVDAQGKCRLVVDMDAVTHMSSASLGVLIPVSNKIRKVKGDLILCAVGDNIRDVFRVTNLEKRFRFCDSTAEALAELNVAED